VSEADFAARESDPSIWHPAGVPATASSLQMIHSTQLAECMTPVLELAAAFQRLMRSRSRTPLSLPLRTNGDRGSAPAMSPNPKRRSPRLRLTVTISLSPRHLGRHPDRRAMANLHSDVLRSSIKAIDIKGGSFRVLGDEHETGIDGSSASFKRPLFALSSRKGLFCGQQTAIVVALTNKISLIR
jgi:hypothetical protein